MKRYIVTILSVISVLLIYKSAAACGCGKDPEETNTPQKLRAAVLKEFQASTAVFSGEIVDWNNYKIKFKVNKIWKGMAAEEVTLSSLYYVNENGKTYVDGCSYSFKVGKSYLIYADVFANVLQVYGCSRTQPLNEADRELKVLDDLKRSVERQFPTKVGFSHLRRNLTIRWTRAEPALLLSTNCS